MEAPLAIRAWTLSYSRVKALAEPVIRNSDNRPRLFFISPHILKATPNKIQQSGYRLSYSFFARTIARYCTGFQLPANFFLFQPALAGNIRLIFQ